MNLDFYKYKLKVSKSVALQLRVLPKPLNKGIEPFSSTPASSTIKNP